MNKDIFKGFSDIKADDCLIEKTKNQIMQPQQKKKSALAIRKLAFAAIPFVIVLTVLTVLLSNSFLTNIFVISAKAEDLMEGINPQNIDVSNSITDNFKNSTQNFSINLFKQSYKSGENNLISPTSAFLALGMTANGASGQTLKEFTNVLGKYGLTVDDLNKAYKAYADELNEKRGKTVLNISNSIWYNIGFKANREFLQKNADFFEAEANSLDFSDKNSVNNINKWVQNNTNNKINKIIDNIDPLDVMFLINTINFEAKWQTPFEKAKKGIFFDSLKSIPKDGYSVTDENANAMFMKLEDVNLDCIETQNETAVLFPYNDKRFAFLGVLPNETEINDYVNNMSENTIPDIINQMSNEKITVFLPKFKVESSNLLNDALKNMGLVTAFGDADFSKMSEDKEALYISSVRQKTFIQVDELGTKAGAATAVGVEKCAVFQPINFNRPFVYAIIDTKTNLPIFIGTMENPQ